MNESDRGQTQSTADTSLNREPQGEGHSGSALPDEAARLWMDLEKKQSVQEGTSWLWLGVALTLGLAVLIIGLWIVVFQ